MSDLGIVLPNNGIALRLIAIASNIPSQSITGIDQFTKYSRPISSVLLHVGASYFLNGSGSNDLAMK